MRKLILLLTLAIVATPLGTFAQDELDQTTFDRSVRVQDDLFLHVNGKWLKETEIPADKSNYGSFIELADLSQKRIKDLIDDVSGQENEPGSLAQKVADFYQSFMNEELVNSLGAKPIQDKLDEVDALASKKDVFEYFGKAQVEGIGAPIAFFVMQDAKDSSRYLAQLLQSGTTLPDRDYYLNDDEKSLAAREALKQYVQTILDLAGVADSASAADQVLKLETRLAEIQWERTELRNAEKRYNKKSMMELQQMAPEFAWGPFLAATEAQGIEEINVWTPSFFEDLQKVFAETSVSTWKTYLKYRVVDSYAPYLSAPFVEANFNLYQKELGGIPEMQPRWKRGVDLVAGSGTGFGVLGDALGELYVARYFPPEAKAQMEELVAYLLTAFDLSIDELTWMTDETKEKARLKLQKITTKIGYTDNWRDYSDLKVDAENLIANIQSSNSVEYHRNIDKLGQPVDKTEWGMTPQTVNAYYNPANNEIVFPAAILQPPFFSPDAPAALNYGGIGAVIGHEISHAFDDQGSKYDGDGNLVNWWTDQDRAAFKELTEKLIAQYGEYEPLTGNHVNGQLTLGENIADLSGLEIAHKAYQLSLDGEEPEKYAGWTGDQLFFVGWSRVWQRKYRDAEMLKRLLTDPHSPSQYRANGPVTNIQAFYKAFDVKEGDGLYKAPKYRIKIW